MCSVIIGSGNDYLQVGGAVARIATPKRPGRLLGGNWSAIGDPPSTRPVNLTQEQLVELFHVSRVAHFLMCCRSYK